MTVQRKLKENADKIDQLIKGNTEEANVDSTPANEAGQTETPHNETSENKEEFKPLDTPMGEDDAKWENRYKSLQGKYNAEVPKLQQELKALKDIQVDTSEVNALRDQVAHLKALLDKAPAAPTDAEMSEKEAKLRADYGDELFDHFNESNRRTQSQIDNVSKELGQTTQELAEADRMTALRQRLQPKGIDFDQRNNDPLFMEYINSTAENGVTLNNILSNAFNRNDISTVERIFLSYGQPQQKSAQANFAGQVQVSPTAGSGFDDANSLVGDSWSSEQIRGFYADKTAGRLSKEDAARYEKSLGAFLARNG